MKKKAMVGLAVMAGLAAIASSAGASSGASSPKPKPSTPGPDEEVPREIAVRVATAAATRDPAKIRAEAAKLRKEGWTEHAADLERLAAELEYEQSQNTKPPATQPPSIPVSTTPPASQPPSTPTKPPPAVRDLKQGQSGEDVRAWQNQLRADGYQLNADGLFGPLTTTATKSWQWERELKDDGIVGKNTRAAIGSKPKRSKPAPATPAPAPSKPPPAPAPAPVKPAPAPAPAPAKPATGPVIGPEPRLLKEGTSGADVYAWQGQLVKDGYVVNVDGVFGPATAAATRAWQLDRGLDDDGIVGPKTRAKIGTPATRRPDTTPLVVHPEKWRTLRRGTTGDDVKEWQLVLNRNGYNVATDGIFGAETEKATKGWQLEHQALPADGIVGPGTRATLTKLLTGNSDAIAGEPAEALPDAPEPVPAAELPALARELVEHLQGAPAGHEDRQLVARFQASVQLNPTGAYGPGTAEALIAFGFVPPKPRVWPTKKRDRARLRFRLAMRTQAAKDPARSQEWLDAANV